MKKILALLILVLIFWKVEAQTTFQERTYRLGSGNRMIIASTVTNQGKVLFAGAVPSVLTDWRSVFMLVQPNLDTIWSRKGPGLYVVDQSINAASNGNFIFGGIADATIGPTFLLQKLNSNCSPIWMNNYISQPGLLRSVLELPNKDLLMAGIYSIGKGFSIIRADSLGYMKWQKDFTWSPTDNLKIMKPAGNGNFIVAGNASYPVPTDHIKLMLVDSNGDSLNGRQLIVNGLNRYEALRTNDNTILSLSDGGFLVSGVVDTTINNANAYLGMLVKVNSNLQLIWKYVYRDTPVWRQFSKMRELPDGSIIAMAYDSEYYNQPSSNKFYFHHFTAYGQPLQTYRFTSALATHLITYAMEALPDSSYIKGGRSYNSTTQQFGFYAAKVKINGLGKALPLISGEKELINAENSLGQSYPNPTTAEAIIPYNLPKNYRQGSIIIREIATGREVKSYALKRNESSLKVDLSNFSNGLYLYSLVVDEKPVATKKLAVMK